MYTLNVAEGKGSTLYGSLCSLLWQRNEKVKREPAQLCKLPIKSTKNMSTLIESYEQQYSSLSAEITVTVGKISNSLGGWYNKYISM